MIQVRDVLMQGTRLLKRRCDTDTPYLDAVLLMGHALKKSKEQVLASLEDPIWETDALSFGKVLELRAKGMPIAYITRKKEFYGLEFYVDSRVLIPRPDTELLVEKGLEAAERFTAGDHSMLDLCTGSGCVGIAFAHTMARKPSGSWQVTLSDISREALAVSAVNSRAILGEELSCIHSDLFEDIAGKFDLIVSNPPYLTDAECADPQLIRRREPSLALRSGRDGLDHIRKIIERAPDHLNDDGVIIIEGGFQQAEDIRRLYESHGFYHIEIHQDMAGLNRAVSARWTRRT
jgi:release factor glutamine methyltransferase